MSLTRRMVLLTALAATLIVVGCIRETIGADGVRISEPSWYDPNVEYDRLTVGEDGLIRCVFSFIKSPTEVEINFRRPRKVRFAGVKAPDRSSFPDDKSYNDLLEEAKGYILHWAGGGNPVFLRPQPGTNLRDEKAIIVGTPLLVAERQPNPERPSFVDLTQGMLSRGLVQLAGDHAMAEFGRPEVARSAWEAQQHARNSRVGVWRYREAATAAGR
jgi:endonuclease YncB( thermonuclease family)